MVSFSTSDERIQTIDSFVKTGYSPDRSTFINTAIDFYLNHIRTKYLTDFMYFFGIPFFIFLVSVGITLYFSNMFFYVISSISGIYLIIFFYLFYNKYRGVKFGVDRK